MKEAPRKRGNYPRRLIALGPPYDDGRIPLDDEQREMRRIAYIVLERNDAGTHERNLALDMLTMLDAIERPDR